MTGSKKNQESLDQHKIREVRRFRRDNILDSFLVIAVLAFFVLLTLLVLNEAGGTNSYAVLASSFFEGRLDVNGCFDVDCVTGPDGRKWVIFPPAPALLVMPFVAIFGNDFSGFRLLAVVMGAISAELWRRNFRVLGLSNYMAIWLTAAVVLASPVISVIVKSNHVWFFAQSVAFLLLTAAIYEALHSKRAFFVGLLVALAFLTRQMSIFYAPLMLVMILDPNRSIFRIDVEVFKKAALIALPIAMSLVLYFTYNWLRFGDIFENGYQFLIGRSEEIVEGDILGNRLQTAGLFSKDYVIFNAIYLLLQGFHFEFSGDMVLMPVKMDRFGTSILAASPFVLIALFAPVRREVIIGWITIMIIVGITLFYHSNGYWQTNTQRYTLDWLPIVFMFLAWSMTPGRFDVARLLILYSIALNIAAFSLPNLFR